MYFFGISTYGIYIPLCIEQKLLKEIIKSVKNHYKDIYVKQKIE